MTIETINAANAFNLIALLVNVTLALACLTLNIVNRTYFLLRSLFAFYLFCSIYFLGMFLYPLQDSSESVIYWYRILLFGLIWMPVAWAWTTHSLAGRKPGSILWINILLGTVFTLAIAFIKHPAVLGEPLSLSPLFNVYRPRSYLFRPLIYSFGLISTGFSLYLLGIKWRENSSFPTLIRPISWAMGFIFLAGTHDALASAGLFNGFLGIYLTWFGSICFSIGLVVAVALHMKDVEKRLIDNEHRLRTLIDSSQDPILSLDTNRVIIDCNPAVEKLLGYSCREMLGRTTRFLHFSTEDYEKFGRTVYPRVEENGSWRGMVPKYHKNGSVVMSDTVISSQKNESGQITGYLSIIRDVTEQAAAEQRLKRQNKYLEALHQTAVGLLERTDSDSLLLSIVTRAAELMETPHCWIVTKNKAGDRIISRYGVGVYEDLVGLELKPGEGLSGMVWDKKDRIAIESFQDFPVKVKSKLGILSAMAGVPLFIGEEFIGVLGVSREKGESGFTAEEVDLLSRLAQLVSITLDNARSYALISRELAERKRAEKALRESERRYRDLFESVSDLIYTQDLEGRFITLNRAVAVTLGYPKEYFIGKTPQAFMKPEHRAFFVTEYLDRVKSKGECQSVALYFNRNGERRLIEYKSVLVKPKEGEPYLSGVGRDVTERVSAAKKLKGLRAQLAQAQKLEAVGTLAGGVAHDFNNILQAFSGYLDIMDAEARNNPQLKRHLPEIRRVLDRAAGLVRRLMTFSRKEKTVLVPVELNWEIVSTVKILERIIPKMIEIKTDLDPDLSLIRGHPSQLEQTLMNLGTNAKDAMPEGGLLSIKTRNVALDQNFTEHHLNAKAGEYVELTVSDTGQGMDRNTMDHMYEPFFTTKAVGQGTGLGLSSVYGIIKDHKGHLHCKSTPGKGTEFQFYLPVHKGKKPALAEERKSAPADGGTETILVVDDELAVRALSRDLLSSRGYEVHVARNGEEAIRIKKKKAGAIDLVILDLGMPGMGGFKCLERLLEIDPGVRVIIASGYSDRSQIRKVEKAGAKGFLGKPYRLNDLLAKVREVLDKAC